MSDWTAVKESYPDSVVFHEDGGLLTVRGGDVQVLSREFGIATKGSWLGFDAEQAWLYMTDLVDRGYDVVKSSLRNVSRVRRVRRGAELRRQRGRGKPASIDASLIFDRAEVERVTSRAWARPYAGVSAAFERCLQSGDRETLLEYGEVCAYQVGEWYEVDWELTSMSRRHVWLLAKAALVLGGDVPCRLVPPRCRRPQPRPFVPLAPHPVGQLSFDWEEAA